MLYCPGCRRKIANREFQRHLKTFKIPQCQQTWRQIQQELLPSAQMQSGPSRQPTQYVTLSLLLSFEALMNDFRDFFQQYHHSTVASDMEDFMTEEEIIEEIDMAVDDGNDYKETPELRDNISESEEEEDFEFEFVVLYKFYFNLDLTLHFRDYFANEQWDSSIEDEEDEDHEEDDKEIREQEQDEEEEDSNWNIDSKEIEYEDEDEEMIEDESISMEIEIEEENNGDKGREVIDKETNEENTVPTDPQISE